MLADRLVVILGSPDKSFIARPAGAHLRLLPGDLLALLGQGAAETQNLLRLLSLSHING